MPSPQFQNLNESITRVLGVASIIDADVTIIPSEHPLKKLSVYLDVFVVRAGESLGVKIDGTGVDLPGGLANGNPIVVDGTTIGTVSSAIADYIEFSFNGAATVDLVQKLMRALTYKDDSGATGFTNWSSIYFDLEDAGGGLAETSMSIGDKVDGTDQIDVFEVNTSKIGSGDELNGGAENDTLSLVGGGDFLIREMKSLVSIETIQGTAADDKIYITGEQLTDVKKIEGGGAATKDILYVSGPTVNLTGKNIAGFGEIQIYDTRGTTVTLDNADLALLVKGTYSLSDNLHLTSGFLTDAQRLSIHRQGIEKVTAKNENGEWVETIHSAPEIAGFGETNVSAAIGATVFLDAGRDSALKVDSGLLSILHVQVDPSLPYENEKIDVDRLSGVSIFKESEPYGASYVTVDGVNIGRVSDLGTRLVYFYFNSEATSARVQKLIQSLTYTRVSGESGGIRKIELNLTDVGNRKSTFSVNVETTVNEAPTGLTLVGTSVREYAATGTKIGALSATDAPGSNLTYEIKLANDTWGSTDGRFKIEGGQLKVANGLLLDYEHEKTHNITIRVTDEGGLSREETFTITVRDVNPEKVVGTAGDDNFVGGAGADVFSGGAGNDVLNGGGGADRLSGGTGNDTYYINSAKDVITEKSSGGKDIVYTSVSYTLGSYVENLHALSSRAITLTGNSLSNAITGNGAANKLYGKAGNDTLDGGKGGDRMYGGSGNDTYMVDSSADVVVETARGGRDKVLTSISHKLAAYVENLIAGGVNSLKLTGNSLGNVIMGGFGSDTINGGSGDDVIYGRAGNDRLTGGKGKDTFVFNDALNASNNLDTITDFNAADDTIKLDKSFFAKLTQTGVLSRSFFRVGSSAEDADDHIIYDKTTGYIYYDDNGNEEGGQVAFAKIGAGKALSNADIVVF